MPKSFYMLYDFENRMPEKNANAGGKLYSGIVIFTVSLPLWSSIGIVAI
jgi:hypothetical protein